MAMAYNIAPDSSVMVLQARILGELHALLMPPALQADSFTTEPSGKLGVSIILLLSLFED